MIPNDRRVLTTEGFKYPSELIAFENVSFVCPIHGNAVLGSVRPNGKGEVWHYSLVPRQNTSGDFWEDLYCNRPTCFPFGDREGFTLDLRKGDRVLAVVADVGYDAASWGKGFMYGCGVTYISSLKPEEYPLYKDRLEGLIVTDQIIGAPEIPYDGKAVEKASFIQGYLSACGWPKRLQTLNKQFIDFFIENAGLAGLVITGKILEHLTTCFETTQVLITYSITYAKGLNTRFFRVISGPNWVNERKNLFSIHLENGGSYAMEGGWTLGSN